MADFFPKRTLSEWSPQPPACATNGTTYAYIAWRGTDNTFLYVAALYFPVWNIASPGPLLDDYAFRQATLDTHQFDGDTSPFSPAIAVLDGRLYIAWVGENNYWLNIAEIMLNNDRSINTDVYGKPYWVDDTYTDENDGTLHTGGHWERDHRIILLQNKQTLSSDTSSLAPCLTAHQGKLYLAWTGDDGDRKINVAVFDSNLALLAKEIIYDTDGRPAVTQYTPALLSAYSGAGGNRGPVLTLARTSYYGEFLLINHIDIATLKLDSSSAFILKESSNFGPGLAYHHGDIYISWTGTDGEQHINVAAVKHYGSNNTSVGFIPITYGDRANGATAIATLTSDILMLGNSEEVMISCWADTDSALNVGVVDQTVR